MSLLQRIFRTKTPASVERFEIMNTSAARFTAWAGDAYANDTYRGAVDAIARNVAKLKGTHVISQDGQRQGVQDELTRLLQVQPNPYMSAFDLLYKLATHYYLDSNAFAFVQRGPRGVSGIYPIAAASVDFVTDPVGTLYARFRFYNGKEVTLPYSDIIHLRRFFNKNDLLGDPNNALAAALEMAHTQNEGIINGIRSSANIRGILKFTSIMAPEKLKEEKDRFIADYLTIANEGGVVATDNKAEYQPITVTPAVVDAKQLAAVKTKIYSYLGISENIVTSSYTEDEWAAFYESIIEPLAVQMSLEFTRKLFNEREQFYGNAIMFESGRLQFSSNATKIKLIAELIPYGLLTINQALEILNLPAVADGDKRLQTLNVVDMAQANKYQLNERKGG